MSDNPRSPRGTWPNAIGQIAEGCGCLIVIALFLLLGSSGEVVKIIQAIRGH